ncbi:MAG: flotillin-like protein FloA [Candidatus Eremiobacteraeota bacterium]|nr:flotillin-like protein FloA [Candidatus Eremiobacteraeota bacterium]
MGSFTPILIILFIGAMVLFHYIPVGLWMEAVSAGVPMNPLHLLVMRLRRVDPADVVRPLIMGRQAGLTDVNAQNLEGHVLAGGRVHRLVRALIEADKANIPLDFQKASAIDLAGRDVLEAVSMSVNPKVIQTVPIAAMAKDGIQVKAICRVTVKANIERLVGGAGEETIIARVGEGVVTTIGSSDSHKNVLENPNLISKQIVAKGLDEGTAFEILSIDIMDVDVGRNIGAHLQIDQAEADKQIAQARAEQRRAEAVAYEQEMKASVAENRARLVLAEAQVPKAMAEAFRQGTLHTQ